MLHALADVLVGRSFSITGNWGLIGTPAKEDEMDKAKVKEAMLALEEAELAHAREKYETFLASAKIDGSEPIETSEASQAVAAGELALAFDHPVHDHAEKIEAIRNIDFGPKDVVEEGAIVRFQGRTFVVAVATDTFDAEGMQMMGISVAAPIYRVLEGNGAGDTCEFNGREIEIEAVW